MNKNEDLELHFVLRFFLGAIPFVLLLNNDEPSSGNSGLGIDLMMFVGVLSLFIFGIFMLLNTIKFLYEKQFNLVLANLLVSVIVTIVFFILESNSIN
jgi:hypothetical protein